MELARVRNHNDEQEYAPVGECSFRSETNYAKAYTSCNENNLFHGVTFVDVAGTGENRGGVKRLISEMSPLFAVNAAENVKALIVLFTFSDLSNSKGKNAKEVIESVVTLLPNINELAEQEVPPSVLGVTNLSEYEVYEIDEKINRLIDYYIEELRLGESDISEQAVAEKALAFLCAIKKHPQNLISITKKDLTNDNLRRRLYDDFFSRLEAPIPSTAFNYSEENRWLRAVRLEIISRVQVISKHIANYNRVSVEYESVKRELGRNKEIKRFRSFNAKGMSKIRDKINNQLLCNDEKIEQLLAEIESINLYILEHDTDEDYLLIEGFYQTPVWRVSLMRFFQDVASTSGEVIGAFAKMFHIPDQTIERLKVLPFEMFSSLCEERKVFYYSTSHAPVEAKIVSQDGKVQGLNDEDLKDGIVSAMVVGEPYKTCSASFKVTTKKRIYYKSQLATKRIKRSSLESQLSRIQAERDMTYQCYS